MYIVSPGAQAWTSWPAPLYNSKRSLSTLRRVPAWHATSSASRAGGIIGRTPRSRSAGPGSCTRVDSLAAGLQVCCPPLDRSVTRAEPPVQCGTCLQPGWPSTPAGRAGLRLHPEQHSVVVRIPRALTWWLVSSSPHLRSGVNPKDRGRGVKVQGRWPCAPSHMTDRLLLIVHFWCMIPSMSQFATRRFHVDFGRMECMCCLG